MSRPVVAYLPLRYVLTDSVVVRTSVDPVHSDPVLSGRAQRGMLAAALRRTGRERELDAWVARGEQVHFAPAHPRLEQHARPGVQVVAHAAPAHLYTPGKDGDTLVDAFAGGTDDPSVPYRAVRDALTPDRSLRAAVRITAERYLGRSRPGEPERGVPFFTTGLDPGQVFEARWRLSGPDHAFVGALAERILEALEAARGTLTLGSGGTRAHGGVEVGPVDPDRPLSPDRVAWPCPDRSRAPGRLVDLLLLSPALVVGAQGQHRPHALVPSVRELWDRCLPGTAPEVVAAHVEPVLVGAYHRAYRGPMTVRRAAAAGSVVRVRPNGGLTTAQVRHLEAHVLGERAVDGYGQFVLLDPPPPVPERFVPPSTPSPTRHKGTVTLPDGRVLPEPGPLDTDADPQLWALHEALLWNAAAQPVRDHARDLARASAPTLDPLTPSLLGRLREVLSDPDHTPDEALTRLHTTLTVRTGPPGSGDHGVLRERAARALERAHLSRPGRAGRITVHRWLVDLSGGAPARTWWRSHRPGEGPDSAYARAVAAVDLTCPDGLPDPARPSGLSHRAEEWEGRSASRLSLLLVSSWLAEASRVLGAVSTRDGGGAR
ncbi:type III-B CRISPR module-associated Cmr3 family protein [Nocardiopsis sp. MG754419]|uniref:type III-B CRISPR module-associated Cmr3 family protein n=1 Tax=Nocardiopsis sp. MG754419 TaxID=2259865 RepID=UPI001BA84074|nr:type III-B CRISPR module-associated Cmr3 family protein [Nocardiopsis sp. MG754419]MBR8745248.1 hypothetical protein [Nocardiopsis sp. MG754419]